VVDVSYGGENGFNQAIALAAESLANVNFVQEKRLIQKYFDEINQDSSRYCFGIEGTLKALELRAVETHRMGELGHHPLCPRRRGDCHPQQQRARKGAQFWRDWWIVEVQSGLYKFYIGR